MTSARIGVVVVVMAAWLGGLAPGAGAQTPPAHVKPLVEAAAREGQLTLVWSSYFLDNGRALKPFQDAFNRTFGLNVTLNLTPSPNLPQLVSRLLQEHQAGQPSTTDIFLGNVPQTVALMKAKALHAPDWRKLGDVADKAIAPDGSAVAWASYFTGVEYNTRAVSPDQVPRRLADVLHPRWKGRIASTPYAAGFDRLALYTGKERMYGFARDLAKQVGGLIRCTDLERLVNGEFDMLVFDCGVFAAQTAARNGLPIGFTILEDATYIDYWYLGIPRNARHPNAATLFVLFLASPEGQKLAYQTDFLDLHLLPRSQSRKLVQPLLDRGVKLPGEAGISDLLAHQAEIEQYRADFPRMLRTR